MEAPCPRNHQKSPKESPGIAAHGRQRAIKTTMFFTRASAAPCLNGSDLKTPSRSYFRRLFLGITRRASAAVRTFEGRAEMLRAASEIWFDSNSRPDLLTDFKAILSAITSYAPRRNDIAHGVVDAWLPEPATASSKLATGWALFPSYASFKDRDVKDLPKYCYTSTEIDYFEKEFSKLIEPVNGLASHLAELGLFKMGVIGMY